MAAPNWLSSRLIIGALSAAVSSTGEEPPASALVTFNMESELTADTAAAVKTEAICDCGNNLDFGDNLVLTADTAPAEKRVPIRDHRKYPDCGCNLS